MELVKSLLVIGYILHISGLVKAGCKNMVFNSSFINKALKGHVFRTEWASNSDDCEHNCYFDDRCIAYSFGQAANGKKEMCELSDSDHVMHPSDLVERDGTIYRRAQNKCDCQPFQVCRVNFEDDTHRCECKPRFTGSRCEIEISKACDSNPCMNNGTCVPQSGFVYSCRCSSAVGVNCETKYSEGQINNFETAIKDCKSQGGNLPSIHNEADNQKVQELYKKAGRWIWIGLRKTNGQYAWSDGTPYDYTNWDAGQTKEDCTHMTHSGKWGSFPCNYHLKYICFFN